MVNKTKSEAANFAYFWIPSCKCYGCFPRNCEEIKFSIKQPDRRGWGDPHFLQRTPKALFLLLNSQKEPENQCAPVSRSTVNKFVFSEWLIPPAVIQNLADHYLLKVPHWVLLKGLMKIRVVIWSPMALKNFEVPLGPMAGPSVLTCTWNNDERYDFIIASSQIRGGPKLTWAFNIFLIEFLGPKQKHKYDLTKTGLSLL